MHTTSASLLERLRQPNERAAWDRFVLLYTPLLFYWACRLGLQASDAADFVQDVLVLLVQKLPAFRYNPDKKFRSWLRTLVLNKWRDRRRQPTLPVAAAGEGGLYDKPDPAGPDVVEEAEYRQHLLKRALHLMQTEFAPRTWRACWEHVVRDRPAAEVAAELGISVGAVYVAKSRVLCRLREELAGLLD